MADRYRQYIDGDPCYALVSDLNAADHRTTRGGLWSEQTLIRYMDSGFCAALLRVHNPQCRCAPEVRGNCPNALFIPGAQEELVSVELWQMYQERREQMRNTAPRARRATYELTGLLRCHHCHGSLAANGRKRVIDGQLVNVPGINYRCGRRTVSGPLSCEGVWVRRSYAEDEVFRWLAREAAPAVDAAPSVPQPRTGVRDERAAAARERARLQAEANKLAQALVNLRTDRAMNPDEYRPGEYEDARDRIRAQQAANTAAMDRVAAVEATPHRADYEPLMVGVVQAWKGLNERERNDMLKQMVRRVVVRKTSDGPAVTGHPVWKPDPWDSDSSQLSQ